MIDEFFILKRDGLDLFHIRLNEDSYTFDMPTELFAGFSSAIVAFTSEFGTGHLSKIEIENKIFVYELFDDFITVAKISNEEDVKTAEHIVDLLYRAFILEYQEELKDYDGTVRKDIFYPFSEIVKNIIEKCEKVAEKNPMLLANIPPSIDIDAILKLSEFSDELVNNFPEATIRLTREFQSKLQENIMNYTLYKLGLVVGKDIVAKKSKDKITDKLIMKLLNEISVCYRENDVITLKICPFCRGRKTKVNDCDFISGFIVGAYDNPMISVKEIHCHAVGDKYCQFKINYKK